MPDTEKLSENLSLVLQHIGRGMELRKLTVVLILLVFSGIGYHLYQYYAISENVRIEGIELNDIQVHQTFGIPTRFMLELGVRVRNPTPYVVDLERFTYSIYIEDELIDDGVKSSVVIPARSVATTTVDLDVSSKEILSTLWSLIQQKGSVRYRITGIIDAPIKMFGVIKSFTVSVPYDVRGTFSSSYILPLSVIEARWTTNTAQANSQAQAYVLLEASTSVEGTLRVVVKKDLALATDVDAYYEDFSVSFSGRREFRLHWTPTESSSGNLRGYHLEVWFNGQKIYTMPDGYPPRLLVTSQPQPEVIDAYWRIDGNKVSEVESEKEVDAVVMLRLSTGDYSGQVKIDIRKDLALQLDKSFISRSFYVSLSSGGSKQLVLGFSPDEISSGTLRGYFIEVSTGKGILYTMLSAYPPRLVVAEKAVTPTLLVIEAYWKSGGRRMDTAYVDQEVKAVINLRASNADFKGNIIFDIRKDLALRPDKSHISQTISLSLSKDQARVLEVTLLPNEASSSSMRGYFIEIRRPTGKVVYTMPSSYPPRLTVNEEVTEGAPSLLNVWWTVNDQVVTVAQKGQTVKANIRIRAQGGSVKGIITIRIRKDIALLPDEDHKVQSLTLSLSKDQVADAVVTFAASEKSGLTFRGYFVQIDFDSWGTKWTMDSSYPPRLKVE